MDIDTKHIEHDLTQSCKQHDFNQGLPGLEFTIPDEYLQLSNNKQMAEMTKNFQTPNSLLIDTAKHYYINPLSYNLVVAEIQEELPDSFKHGKLEAIMQIKSCLIEISETSFKDQIGKVPMISLNAHKRSVDVYEQLSIKQKLRIIELESKLQMAENNSGWFRKLIKTFI